MGKPSLQVIAFLAAVAGLGSYLATFYHRQTITVDLFLSFLLTYWLFFFGSYLFFHFLLFYQASRNHRHRWQPSAFAPSIHIRSLRREELLPPLLVPKPQPPPEKQEPEKKEEKKKLDKIKTKDAATLARAIRNTWLIQ